MGAPAGLYTVSRMREMGAGTGLKDATGPNVAVLQAQDQGREAGYVIYVYNILNREYTVVAPPKFPAFKIPACPKGEPFSFTVLPAFTKEVFRRPETDEFYYRQVDGRKDATTLLNSNAFPGTDWASQLANWNSEETAITGNNNNLNSFGVFWSMTAPDETEKLTEEIKLFRDYATRTMNGLVKQAELLAAQGKLHEITPNMHFAMDYLGKQAAWHMTTDHMISCPNCGDIIKDGIAYHKNSWGEKCVLDWRRVVKLGAAKLEDVPLDSRWWSEDDKPEEKPAAKGRQPRKSA